MSTDPESAAVPNDPKVAAAMQALVLGLARVAGMADRQIRITRRLGFVASLGAAGFASVTVMGQMPSPGGWIAAGSAALIAVFASYAGATARQRKLKAEDALREIHEKRQAATGS